MANTNGKLFTQRSRRGLFEGNLKRIRLWFFEWCRRFFEPVRVSAPFRLPVRPVSRTISAKLSRDNDGGSLLNHFPCDRLFGRRQPKALPRRRRTNDGGPESPAIHSWNQQVTRSGLGGNSTSGWAAVEGLASQDLQEEDAPLCRIDNGPLNGDSSRDCGHIFRSAGNQNNNKQPHVRFHEKPEKLWKNTMSIKVLAKSRSSRLWEFPECGAPKW